jgi:hypothetical protein
LKHSQQPFVATPLPMGVSEDVPRERFPMLSAHVIDSVLLMTPENIHLNAFMYEPIVDMADDHLKKLYKDVTALV